MDDMLIALWKSSRKNPHAAKILDDMFPEIVDAVLRGNGEAYRNLLKVAIARVEQSSITPRPRSIVPSERLNLRRTY